MTVDMIFSLNIFPKEKHLSPTFLGVSTVQFQGIEQHFGYQKFFGLHSFDASDLVGLYNNPQQSAVDLCF